MVLLDLNLPDMAVDEVYREIRKQIEVPVILTRGQSTEGIANVYGELGFAEILEKSISVETLLNTIENVMQGRI